ncbi:hypothetical protein [Streptomyces violascens]|uniref:hypothetical protein n=1 Tax=Streptomyces violascens TaxID=67381 RepID=UPI00167283D3|nr:hypothetical protein [Streptomyces violascens]GGU29963.1 hypothetical protein GCM10010289_59230 [Streptomyces violascens]
MSTQTDDPWAAGYEEAEPQQVGPQEPPPSDQDSPTLDSGNDILKNPIKKIGDKVSHGTIPGSTCKVTHWDKMWAKDQWTKMSESDHGYPSSETEPIHIDSGCTWTTGQQFKVVKEVGPHRYARYRRLSDDREFYMYASWPSGHDAAWVETDVKIPSGHWAGQNAWIGIQNCARA